MDISPQIINKIVPSFSEEVFFYPDYPEKLLEVKRIIKKNISTKELNIDEIQSDDPIKAVKFKAYDAWKKNNYNPILVEDTSLNIFSMNGFPGTYAAYFTKTLDQRIHICKTVSANKDKRVFARALVAYYDGIKFKFWDSVTHGIISDAPRGSYGFGWDDIFIPFIKNKPAGNTFAEMNGNKKDLFSMRGKVWRKIFEKNISYTQPVYKIPEPYDEEVRRIRHEEITKRGKIFAYSIESIEKSNAKSNNLTADAYIPVVKEQNIFYRRYSQNPKSPSLGIVLTNIDLDRIERFANQEPVFWQMGPRRRTLALAQRAHFFDQNQNIKVHKILKDYESGEKGIPPRANRRLGAVERALGMTKSYISARHTPAISELGYKKISTDKKLSRREIISYGLFNKIGKYPRKIIGLGSMPPTAGWRDTIIASAVGHMVCFIPRNSVFAADIKRRIDLVKSAKDAINSLPIPRQWHQRIQRNIGASLGLDSPKEEVKTAALLYKKAGIKLFRIYTIGSDKRILDVTKALRSEFGNSAEIFVGQIADKKQAESLLRPSISADALIYGHGGGQQCTSAINGMAITTLEDIYEIVLDPAFNNTSILVEGGVDRAIGTALIIGVDCCLGNQKLVHGTIETGDLFIQTKRGKVGQPYPGSASPVTQIIESEDVRTRSRRTDASGRTYNAEGKPGFMYFEKKANSMSFWINEYQAHAARTLADLGVRNIAELRSLLNKDKREFLRTMSEKTQYMSDAYGNYS